MQLYPYQIIQGFTNHLLTADQKCNTEKRKSKLSLNEKHLESNSKKLIVSGKITITKLRLNIKLSILI